MRITTSFKTEVGLYEVLYEEFYGTLGSGPIEFSLDVFTEFAEFSDEKILSLQ